MAVFSQLTTVLDTTLNSTIWIDHLSSHTHWCFRIHGNVSKILFDLITCSAVYEHLCFRLVLLWTRSPSFHPFLIHEQCIACLDPVLQAQVALTDYHDLCSHSDQSYPDAWNSFTHSGLLPGSVTYRRIYTYKPSRASCCFKTVPCLLHLSGSSSPALLFQMVCWDHTYLVWCAGHATPYSCYPVFKRISISRLCPANPRHRLDTSMQGSRSHSENMVTFAAVYAPEYYSRDWRLKKVTHNLTEWRSAPTLSRNKEIKAIVMD